MAKRKRTTYKALLRIGGQPVPIEVRINPRARKLIVKVHPSTGEVSVVSPSIRGVPEALEFARGESDWIASRLARVPSAVPFESGRVVPYRGQPHEIRNGDAGHGAVWIDPQAPIIRVAGRPEHESRRVEEWLKKQARTQFTRRAQAFAGDLGVTVRRVTVRDGASRWGSCSSSRALAFSWRLVMAPPFVLDYVAAHEVAHLREMNHGPRFWSLVEYLVGDPEAAIEWLRLNGADLHRYGAPGRRAAA